MSQHVIYFPGVNEHNNSEIQIKALEKWRKFGIEPHFQHIGWNEKDSYDSKLKRSIKFIDELLVSNKQVSLIGVSAGASLAMGVYAKRKSKIDAAIFICGKINNPQTLGDNYKNKNPALFESITNSAKVAPELDDQDRQKMLTLFPIFDGTVTRSDGTISGVKNRTLVSITHPLSIYLSITLYKRLSINFLKSKALQ